MRLLYFASSYQSIYRHVQIPRVSETVFQNKASQPISTTFRRAPQSTLQSAARMGSPFQLTYYPWPYIAVPRVGGAAGSYLAIENR